MNVGKRIVQINPVLRISTSTGRIMQEIGALAQSEGWKVWCAYGKGRDRNSNCSIDTIPVGGVWSTAVHGILTRLFDRHGLGSAAATLRFVDTLREIDPDIVHIHNIHGYFLNYPVLFDYLAGSRAKVVWTVHDCWLYTGHCYYYSAVGCGKWRTGCGSCVQRGEFPRSLFIDRSKRNFEDKKKYFTSVPVDRMVIVPVSDWMRREMSGSFFAGYPFEVIHNGINTEIFRPCGASDIRSRFGIPTDKKIILGVAGKWSKEKGLDDFIEISRRLNPDEVIVLVGTDVRTVRSLPSGIIGIRRTDNIDMLAQLYSEATVFVNPTRQDNYPTVNLEAISCGVPVVTYRTGGSVESVTPETGRIVGCGDIDGLLAAVRDIESEGAGSFKNICRGYALANFRKEDRYADYLRLYEKLVE